MPAYDSIFTGAQVDEAIQKYFTIKNNNNDIWTPLAQSSTSGYFLRGDGAWSNIIQGNITATKFIGNLEGNADTATELKTPGTAGQFWRGDNNWSNILAGPLIIDTGLNPDGNTLGHGIKLWHDNEGGNIAIYSGNNNSIQWQIDAFDGNLRFFSNDGTDYSFPLTLTASSKLVCFGSRITTTAPTALSRVDRMIITPYYHTGGPWYICSRDDASNAHLSLYYGTNEVMTWRHNARLTSNLYMAGNLYIGTDGGGGLLNGGATNGGINSIKIGDDVWLGDCNQSGIMGMKSTATNCGFWFYNSSGSNTAQFYYNGSGFYFNQTLRHPQASVSYIGGGNGQGAALYAQKGYQATAWYPAVVLDTYGGGSWQIGNYTAETLQFVYATKANRDSNTNTVSILNLTGANGTITTSASSSYTVKTNIENLLDEEAKKLLDINIIHFDYKEGYGDTNQVGIIAEELQEIIPQPIVNVNNSLSIDYTKFVPYLIKFSQILYNEIQDLKKEIVNLKSEK